MFYISLEVTITWYALVDDTIVTYDDVYKAWFTKIFQLIISKCQTEVTYIWHIIFLVVSKWIFRKKLCLIFFCWLVIEARNRFL